MVFVRKFTQFVPATPQEVVGIAAGANAIGPNSGGGGAGITYTFTQATVVEPPLYLGAAVRVDVGTGLWECCLADDPLDAEFYAFIVGIAGTTYTVQFAGTPPAGIPAFADLVPGTPMYLSSTIAGGISAIPPNLNGNVNYPVLWAMDSGNPVIRMSRGFINGPTSGGGGGGGTPNNVLTITQPISFALGDAIYLASDQTFAKANAYTTKAAAQAEWIVTSIVTPGHVYTIQQGGMISGPIFIDDVGAPIVSGPIYYVSPTPTQEGRLTQIEPVGPGQFSKPMYVQQIVSNNTGWILDQRPTVVATGGRAFIGQLNAANNFDSTQGIPFVLGGYSIYYLEMNIGTGGGGHGPGIEAIGAGPVSFGFELLLNGVFYTGTNYAHLCSGINSTANTPGAGVLWGDVKPGTGDNSLIMFPPIAGTDIILGGFTATMNISPNNTTVVLQYQSYFSDLTNFPAFAPIWTSEGIAQMGEPGVCTGIRLSYGPGVLQPGSQAFINVYGEIGS